MKEIIRSQNIALSKQNSINFFIEIFLEVWIKLDKEVILEKKNNLNLNQVKLLKNINNTTFVYLECANTKLSSKFFKEFIKIKSENWEEEFYWKNLWEYDFLVFLVKNEDKLFIYWVDCLNKTKLKVSSFKIDNIWFEDYKTNELKYRNRTLNEQFLEFQKSLDWWEKEINRRMLLSFFEKKNLTEEFYKVYKNEIFEKIKASNLEKTHNEADLNHFILVNLNRLLFIHFLDKKWDIFKNYDKKYWSFLAYLKHNTYKKLETTNNFYETILTPLFFDIFSKPKKDRNETSLEDAWIKELFYDLPYLNWWLFKKSRFDEMWFTIKNKEIYDFIEKIIDSFNFTIEEDTPLEVRISVDPELLWYIFENLIQDYDNSKGNDNERSKWWIFYTPKIEVDFMCRQAIVEYLAKKEEFLKLEKKEQLYKLVYRENGKKWDQEYGSFTENEIEKIFTYLEELKVVDPTCWSWAFLVGMLQVIIDIEDTLKEHHKSHYDDLIKNYKIIEKGLFTRKKELIKNTLYWVDVKTWAVEIAKLRLWLSMILDVEAEYFEKEESKNNPLLPSFSFKIVCWDSILNTIWNEIIPVDFTSSINIDTILKSKIKKLIWLKNDFYNNLIKDESIVLNEEKQIYIDLLTEKIKFDKKTIENAKVVLWVNQINIFWENDSNISEKSEKSIKELVKDTELKIKLNENLKNQISLQNKIPFAWSIDFAEVFQEKWWFDILVWNPPYVRQEQIEDPNGNIKDKKKYKEMLEKTINNDFLDEVNKNFDLKIKVWWRSDLYVYFYFRWLKLINDNGIFAFITSNSWLDVDFGSSLQEFLLKFVDNISIYDNSAERSFANASINTIIAIFDKPRFYKKDLKYKKLRDLENDFWNTKFINFKKSFEEVIYSENFREFEDIYKSSVVENLEEKTIKTWEISFRKKSNEDFRIVYVDNKSLFIDWSEKIESKIWGSFYKYEWNKWGWKYLKAPDIFFTILEKWGEKLVKWRNIFELTQRNTLQNINKIEIVDYTDKEENDIPYLSSSKDTNSIVFDNFKKLISIWKSEFKNNKEILIPDIISNRFIWERLFFIEWWKFLVWDTFFVWKLFENFDRELVLAILNSSLSLFFVENIWRKNMWDWVLLFYWLELNILPFLNINNIDLKDKIKTLKSREIKSIFEELWFDKNKDIREQNPNPLPDRKELDDIIFDEIWLSDEERKEVYLSLGELVKSRLDKAKSK